MLNKVTKKAHKNPNVTFQAYQLIIPMKSWFAWKHHIVYFFGCAGFSCSFDILWLILDVYILNIKK